MHEHPPKKEKLNDPAKSAIIKEERKGQRKLFLHGPDKCSTISMLGLTRNQIKPLSFLRS